MFGQYLSRVLFASVLLILLAVMLFPIGWMVITSLKSNNDILVGHLWFTRYSNQIQAMFMHNGNMYMATENGAYLRSDGKTHAFKTLSKGQEVASAFFKAPGRELIQATKTDVRVRDAVDGQELRQIPVVDLPWLWRENIKSSCVAVVSHRAYVGHLVLKSPEEEHQSYPGQGVLEGLQIVDLKENRYLKTLKQDEGLPENNITALLPWGADLWVGTTRGLARVRQDQVVQVLGAAQGVPGMVQCLWSDGTTLFVGTEDGLVLLDADGALIGRLGQSQGLLKDDVLSIAGAGSLLFVGGPTGLSVYDRALERTVHVLERSGQQPWKVTALSVAGDFLWVGTADGYVRKLQRERYSVEDENRAPETPYNIRWTNYVQLWKNISFGTYFKNSLIICLITTLIAMTLATLAAYALSRFEFPGSNLFSTAILATQMIPGLMFLIPIYLMFVKFHEWFGIQFINSYKGVIFVYSGFCVAFLPLFRSA